MYNCSSWAAPLDVIRKLDVCHRNHLRQILKIRYPNTISNNKLYEKCSSIPLSERVKKSRWKMFGHILRSPENSPASLALSFAVTGTSEISGRRGRHRINLLSLLRKDISRLHMSSNTLITQKLTLKNTDDIYLLRDLAKHRVEWRKLYNYV